jgi:hypothetical protein
MVIAALMTPPRSSNATAFGIASSRAACGFYGLPRIFSGTRFADGSIGGCQSERAASSACRRPTHPSEGYPWIRSAGEVFPWRIARPLPKSGRRYLALPASFLGLNCTTASLSSPTAASASPNSFATLGCVDLHADDTRFTAHRPFFAIYPAFRNEAQWAAIRVRDLNPCS